MKETITNEDIELNNRLEEINKAREKEEKLLEQMTDQEKIDFLVEKYKQNSEILKKGNFKVIDDGEV